MRAGTNSQVQAWRLYNFCTHMDAPTYTGVHLAIPKLSSKIAFSLIRRESFFPSTFFWRLSRLFYVDHDQIKLCTDCLNLYTAGLARVSLVLIEGFSEIIMQSQARYLTGEKLVENVEYYCFRFMNLCFIRMALCTKLFFSYHSISQDNHFSME